MKRQMSILLPALTLNTMKGAAKVEEIHYTVEDDLTLTPNSTTQVKQKMI